MEPRLEGLPDQKSTLLVEKRSYNEYTVFWPSGSSKLYEGVIRGWKQPIFRGGPRSKAAWVPRSLHVKSGLVTRSDGDQDFRQQPDDWVDGYLFKLDDTGRSDDAGTFPALPSVCPSCGTDYSNRNRLNKSPLRGFRTGFAKMSQVLTKELFYQLPDPGAEKATRKLVVFSDSREDAAQISSGVERNNYSDLFREALVKELHMAAFGAPQLLEDLEAYAESNGSLEGVRRSDLSCQLSREYWDNYGEDLDEMLADMETVSEGLPDKSQVKKGHYALLEQHVKEAQGRLQSIRATATDRTVPVDVLVSRSRSRELDCGRLIRRLLATGTNPAGNDLEFQEPEWGGRPYRWTELYDFGALCWNVALPDVADSAKDDVRTEIRKKVCDVFFTRLYYSFESSGLGYIKLRLNDGRLTELAGRAGVSSALFREVCDSALRILGDLYRHEASDFTHDDWVDYADVKARLRKYIAAVVWVAGDDVEEDLLGNAILRALEEAGHRGIIIETIALDVLAALPGDPVWTCPRCRRRHLHRSARVCTNCNETLNEDPDSVCEALWGGNYYSLPAATKRAPLRLHCEELTGQTDDQAKRQREFRGVFLDAGNEDQQTLRLVDEVDVLV